MTYLLCFLHGTLVEFTRQNMNIDRINNSPKFSENLRVQKMN